MLVYLCIRVVRVVCVFLIVHVHDDRWVRQSHWSHALLWWCLWDTAQKFLVLPIVAVVVRRGVVVSQSFVEGKVSLALYPHMLQFLHAIFSMHVFFEYHSPTKICRKTAYWETLLYLQHLKCIKHMWKNSVPSSTCHNLPVTSSTLTLLAWERLLLAATRLTVFHVVLCVQSVDIWHIFQHEHTYQYTTGI